MKIVSIGSSGFLGGHLSTALAAAGHQQIILTRQPGRRRALRLQPGVSLRLCDVYSPEALSEQLSGADVVISMAGILNEKGRSGRGFERVHVDLVSSLIEACKQSDVHRVVHVSALNAGKGKSHYLRTKGAAEAALSHSGLDVTVLRPSVIFGAGDDFFNRFAALLKLIPVLPLACAHSRLQPVWVEDVVQALRHAVETPATAGETWELGGPRVYTLGELVRWTAQVEGLRRAVIGLPGPVSRGQAAIMDFVPGKPFSTDNYYSLQLDSVTQSNVWRSLGISPSSVEAKVPDYLSHSPRQRRLDRARSSQSIR